MKEHHTIASVVDSLAERGDRTSVVAFRKNDTERWSYARLSDEVAKLSRGLAARGVGCGDHAALLADPSPEWIVACLAVVRAGASVVPLDAQTDEETLAHVLGDSAARLVFTDAEGAAKLGRLDAPPEHARLDVEGDADGGWRSLLSEDGEGELPEVRPQDEAVLFYTSGTTGTAKGVPLTHANLAYQANTLAAAGIVTDNDRPLLPLPFHHVYPFAFGLLVPLALGLPIILPEALVGPQIVRAIKEGDATLIIGVPRLYRAVFSAISERARSQGALKAQVFERSLALSTLLLRRFGARAGKRLLRPMHERLGPNLRILASGGSPLDEGLARNLEGLGWQVAIGYGLTETSPLLTLNPPGSGKLGSVGPPVEGTELRIDPSAMPDADGDHDGAASRGGGPQAAEFGVEGEVLARGPGVFAGYRNLPEKTREAFTDDGWFRTGDLGYVGEDGHLYLTGRTSTLIVTEGGKNVQPEDVEEAYLKSPAIAEIGVLGRDGRLVALVVPDPAGVRESGHTDVEAAVRAAVAGVSRGLPSYRRLSEYSVTREPLAYTRLGKLRRHVLETHYEAARSGEEGQESGPVALEDLSLEDRALLLNPAAEAVWDLLVDRYPKGRIAPETDLRLDLGVDSMEWVALSLEIGRRSGAELDEEEIERIETVRDLLDAVVTASEAGRLHTGLSPLERPENMLGERQAAFLRPLSPAESAASSAMYAVNRAAARVLFGLRVEGLERLPREGPFVVAPNHVSYLDAFVVAAALDGARLSRTRWAGWADTVFSNPLFRLVGRLARVVPVDPHRAVLSTLALGAAVLGRGDALVWFPEGARSPDGALQPFRPGIGALLARNRVPVVPVFIRGTREAMPPGNALVRPGKVEVVFGQPVHPDTLEREGEGATSEGRISSALRDRVAELGGLSRGSQREVTA